MAITLDKFNKSAGYTVLAATTSVLLPLSHCSLSPQRRARDITIVTYTQLVCDITIVTCTQLVCDITIVTCTQLVCDITIVTYTQLVCDITIVTYMQLLYAAVIIICWVNSTNLYPKDKCNKAFVPLPLNIRTLP